MIALVDCNNFYVSCERLFRPELRKKPVIVMSNNDGCVVSRSQQAKDLGIKMAVPVYKIQELIKRHQIAIFSSNYALYADMSARVMNNLARFTPLFDVYSIDECFLGLDGIPDPDNYCISMRQQVMRNTGIPISIGAAPSKTLAKIANKLAKECITGVCVLDTAEKIQQALKNFPVSDVWGIGRKYGKKYQKHDIYFAGQIVDKSVEWMQKEFTIHGVRMWYELQGLSTLQLGVKREPKKAIACSKSFGKPTSRISDLSEAISSYASRVGEKLREERSCAGILSVQLSTNRFKKDQTYYSPYISIPLAYPCNNTSMLVKMAVEAVHRLYKPNYQFIKAAVMVTGLIPESEVQLNVFTTWKDQDKLSKVLDSLNSHYGKGTLRMASEGFLKPWNMRQEYLSPAYTTRWKDIIKVN